MRKAQLADFVAKRRKQKKEQGREGSNFEESGSRGIREEEELSWEYRKIKKSEARTRREVCFHAMIDKLDAFLCYYLFLLLIFSHRVLSSYPNFSVIFTPGELIRVWCQGLRSLCGVHRSPDWLNSRPLRWLSCHRRLHHFSRSLHFSEGLDVADLSQDGKFASVFPTGNAPHRRSIGCPVATRRSSN
jgi:hypothetical protein